MSHYRRLVAQSLPKEGQRFAVVTLRLYSRVTVKDTVTCCISHSHTPPVASSHLASHVFFGGAVERNLKGEAAQ